IELKGQSPIEIKVDAYGDNLVMQYDSSSADAKAFAAEVLRRLKQNPNGYCLTEEAENFGKVAIPKPPRPRASPVPSVHSSLMSTGSGPSSLGMTTRESNSTSVTASPSRDPAPPRPSMISTGSLSSTGITSVESTFAPTPLVMTPPKPKTKTPLNQTPRSSAGAVGNSRVEEIGIVAGRKGASPSVEVEDLGIISNPHGIDPKTGLKFRAPGGNGIEERMGFGGLTSGEALRAGLSTGEALAAGLPKNPPGAHLDLGDNSYDPFLQTRAWKLSRDADTDTLNSMTITAFRDIEPAGWEKAKAAFVDTLTELKHGNCGTMSDGLDPGQVAAYEKSYAREGRAFFENMEIPSKDAGNEFTVRGVDPQTNQSYVTQVKYDPDSRSVQQVFPRSEGTDSSNFAPGDKQLLIAFEMLRNVGLQSKGKEFTIAGTTNTDLIIKCIQLGNSLDLVPKMSEKVEKAMLKKISENVDEFKAFGGSSPQEVLESIKGSTYKGILPHGMPIDPRNESGHRNRF
ncbi:MAG: hypothetical protein HOI53_01365, partial [Francisellaceae bacterium]|nr:hypothetical protein [Francisellaceae bacterium]